jgi:hypothetical protein
MIVTGNSRHLEERSTIGISGIFLQQTLVL